MKTISIILTFVLTLTCLGFKMRAKKLFVIGDSISIYYGPYLNLFIGDRYQYDRKRDNGEAMRDLDKPIGANGGDSRMVVEYLRSLKEDGAFSADFLMINCGLHDIKTNQETGGKQVELEEYRKNLKMILQLSKELKTKLIWVTSTPVNDTIHNRNRVGFLRYNKDVIAYNQEAVSFFLKEKIPVIDLYDFSQTFPAEAYSDHVHYHPEYARLQAAYIAGFLSYE